VLTELKKWWIKGKGTWKWTLTAEPVKSARSHKGEEMNVSLKDLSQVWQQYNKDFKAGIVPVSRSSPETLPDILTGGADMSELPEREATGLTASPPPPANWEDGWSNEASEFIRDVVNPDKNLCMQAMALDGIYQIIKILDEQGGCASIVAKGKDSKDNDLESVRDFLLQVTLRQHSFRVARLGVERYKRDVKDYEPMLPWMIVAALGHDLGKIEAMRNTHSDRIVALKNSRLTMDPEMKDSSCSLTSYSKHDHPSISATLIATIFANHDNDRALRMTVETILNHHNSRKSPPQLEGDLVYADGKAREMEIAKVTGRQMKEWKDWFDPKEFLTRLRPIINVIALKSAWGAFSFGGIVYFSPTVFQAEAAKYAVEKNVIDLSLMKAKESNFAATKIVKSLREINAVSNELANEKDSYRQYEISTTQSPNTKVLPLIALKIELFGLPSELDKNKDGSYYTIKSVKPKETKGRQDYD